KDPDPDDVPRLPGEDPDPAAGVGQAAQLAGVLLPLLLDDEDEERRAKWPSTSRVDSSIKRPAFKPRVDSSIRSVGSSIRGIGTVKSPDPDPDLVRDDDENSESPTSMKNPTSTKSVSVSSPWDH